MQNLRRLFSGLSGRQQYIRYRVHRSFIPVRFGARLVLTYGLVAPLFSLFESHIQATLDNIQNR